MAEIDVFYCEPRERAGTGGARAVRRENWVPGVLYGGGAEPIAIKLRKNEIDKAYHAGRMRAHLANIDVPGQKALQPVLAREVQVDPVKGFPIHVDLMRVDETTRIDVEVPVRFVNEDDSPGLKRGGVLNIVRHAIEVYAPAVAIPEFFEADVTGLDIGDGIHVSAISMPEGVTPTITDRDFTVATIAAPSGLLTEEEEEAAAEAAAEGEAEAEGEEGAGEAEADSDSKEGGGE